MATDPAKAIKATLAACATAAGLVLAYEGWRNTTYLDPIGIPTSCAGITGSAVRAGKTYTDQECIALTSLALVKHGLDIAPCLPAALPDETRAAFISVAYNIGTGAFCKSSMARKATAGDLRGACASLDLWIKAGGRILPGLVRRRAAERQLCEHGLT